MRKCIRVFFSSLILLSTGLPPALFALETIVAPKAASAPVIDGILDDAVWGEALKFTAFKTIKPDFGKEPGQKTEGYFLFDAENFYVAF